MDELRHSLRPLEWSLGLSGLCLFKLSSLWLRCFLIIQFIILNSWSVMSVFTFLQWRMSEPPNSLNLGVMYTWEYTIMQVFGVISSATMIFSRNQLKCILEELCHDLSRKQYKNLFRTTLFFLIYRIVKQVDRLVNIYYYWILDFEEAISLTGGLNIYRFWFDSWEVISLATFIAVLKVIHFAEKNIMTNLTNRLDETNKNMNQNTVYISITKILQMKQLLTKSISFTICLSFVHIFADFVLAAIRLQKPRFTFSHKEFVLVRLDTVRLVMNLLEMVYLTTLTTNLCQESRENLDSLENKIALTQKPRKWIFVMEKIQKAQNFQYLAWNLFPINKQVLLSFTAALVSFTVLFAQLLNQVI